MNEQEAGQYWNNNAEAWTVLARAGFDVYRDYLNTPAFFAMLPDIQGLSGIDIGCGEGHNTRLLAAEAAGMHGIDISPVFIQHAKAAEVQRGGNIGYQLASATALPFDDASFDFATSFMCLMDIPEPQLALQEAFRVIKPGGFLQFSITHPCFTTPHRKNLRHFGTRTTYAIEVGNYFQPLNGRIEEWIFKSAPLSLKSQYPKFRVPLFNFTLSQWFCAMLNSGFIIEQLNEPYPDEEMVAKYPALQDAQVVAYFMHIRCRKP